MSYSVNTYLCIGGHLGIFLGGYVPPASPNWHPVLEMG